MILAVDIGNSSVALGVGVQGGVKHMLRCKNSASAAASILAQISADYNPTAAAIASVVPSSNCIWQDAIAAEFGLQPLMVAHDLELGIGVDYPEPASIGADRLANAVAAVGLFGAPVVVADFGTALTFDIVSQERSYVGGVIAPGLGLMLDYLADRTALLPHVEFRKMEGIVGKSTEDAILIGAHHGYLGLVEAIRCELEREIGEHSFCATGGFAGSILDGADPRISFVPELTLLGIMDICAHNRPPKLSVNGETRVGMI